MSAAITPSQCHYTGEREVMPWATKRRFAHLDSSGAEIPGARGWELVYETPEQETEHERLIRDAHRALPNQPNRTRLVRVF
jgi:hypothetical protein